MASGKPFVSEGITTRQTNERAVVMAVPTHDGAGRLTGVLAGVLLVGPSSIGRSSSSLDLGFAGLAESEAQVRAAAPLVDAAFAGARRSLYARPLVAGGLDLAARYNAGGTGLEIGGDWYDAVHRDDGLKASPWSWLRSRRARS